ncbi:transmembrane amino acid transporter protein-domain-containing protein [Mycotypha africana]|uniref:transmembrane amino acid transporter protein-domain-containing protein n=1 Tax=Mycotypha africana TaxID=64632 RepID=UPI0023003BDD|nr:transmembrane amino acid transporter protein-domain-containing protein [Mycotypha africana]KAI8967884.1 transmembrane amino acid transporter protein-domain-containing protein [Mycotypha africana]
MEDSKVGSGNNADSEHFDRIKVTAKLSTSPQPHLNNVHTSPPPSRSIHSHETNKKSISAKDVTHSTHNKSSSPSTDMLDDEVAKVVKRHLVLSSSPVSQNSYLNVPSAHGSRPSSQEMQSPEDIVEGSHHLRGGAITHDIYKWTEDQERKKAEMKRSRSMMVRPRHESSNPALTNLRDPGGFRRHYVIDRAVKRGKKPPATITHSFVDFLAMYGHFGGEDLSDNEGVSSDEEDVEDLAESSNERTALIRQAKADAVEGTATPTKAVFLLLKSFIGTGVMFLPKAFHNGGLLFSTLFLVFIAIVSLYCFLLLVQTRNKIPASFGDIGGILFGNNMRVLVLIAITTSQIGFVCAYMVFVAQSVQALIQAITDCQKSVSLAYLILAQVAIFVPMAMIRKIQKLSIFALIADAFILLGLAYLYYYDAYVLIMEGVGNVEWIVNVSSFPMFIGTAVFTFEGVGLIIPIAESMKEPKRFPKVLSGTMLFITLLFISIGLLSYLAFGEDVQTVILLNLPNTSTVSTIQSLYAIAICLSIPLQLFPAIRIIETGLFMRSGKHNLVVKWEKNIFRFVGVLFCAIVAILGSSDLDKFVSLIGSVFCIPLCFLFPPLFHLKGVAHGWGQKTIDILIIIFGILCMIYTTYVTVCLWTEEESAATVPVTRCATPIL